MIEVEELFIQKTDRNPASFIKTQAKEADYEQLICNSSFVNLEGSRPLLYLDLNHSDFEELWEYLDSIDFPASSRKSLGQNNKSLLFGAVPASINKNNFCTFGAIARRDEMLNMLLESKYSTILHELLRYYTPEWAKINAHLWKKADIHSDYQLGSSFWTSGIINKNSPHNYHYDGMNVRNMLSAMITLKKSMSGGYLVFPEFNVAFEVKNRSVIFFCGSGLLHGVTPMKLHGNGRRYSIVYYTTEQLKRCEAFEHELEKSLK